MSDDLPEHYFRIRENGATVFRVVTENRQRRMELEEIATVILRNGAIRPRNNITLTPADEAAIAGWLTARQAELAQREADLLRRTVEDLNLATHWAQSRATPAQLAAVMDELLLAMHDLRNVLIRKKAEQLTAGTADKTSADD